MALPLLPVAVATAVLTLKSDTKPVQVFVKKPRGTLYWGGAGLDGDYVAPTVKALYAAGIQHISVGLTNSASQDLAKLGTLVDAIRAGLLIRYEDSGDWVITSGMNNASTQFNLIGYSYGSLLAAQTANYYAKHGHVVDHLVLIGSPIDHDFLQALGGNKNIKKVFVLNLTEHGDPLYARMSQAAMLDPRTLHTLGRDMANGKGEGHFYYGHPVPDLEKRLPALRFANGASYSQEIGTRNYPSYVEVAVFIYADICNPMGYRRGSIRIH